MNRTWRLITLTAVTILACGCARSKVPELRFSGAQAYEQVRLQCDIGPRSFGSEGGRRTVQLIVAELQKWGWTAEEHPVTYRGVTGANVVGKKGQGPLVLFGAHFDSRSVADRDPHDRTQPVPGANDGASGVAVLLELARVLDVEQAGAEVWLVFFDAEDQGNLAGWPFSVGASAFAQQMQVEPQAVVVVDMIGDAHQEIFWERHSDAALMAELWEIAADLGYAEHFVPRYGYAIIDDHLPFIERGWTAVDIIDFDYPYWHTVQDTVDKVSPDSLERVGRVLEAWLEDGHFAESDY